MVTDALFFALASTVAMIVLVMKVHPRKLLGYDWALDIGAMLVMMVAFQGSVTGMGAAMVSGVFMSVVLAALKHYLIGYEKLVRVSFFRYRWRYYPPKRPQHPPSSDA